MIRLGPVHLDVVLSPWALWWWHYRKHVRRLWRRHIPSLALRCDWCNGPIEAVERHRGMYIAGCLTCSEQLGWGWYAGAGSEQEALDNWRRTGGDEFVGKVVLRAPPPSFWDTYEKVQENAPHPFGKEVHWT